MSKLSISKKLTLIIVAIVTIGCFGLLLVQTEYYRNILETDNLNKNTRITELLAAKLAPAVNWQRAERVQEAYAPLIAVDENEVAEIVVHIKNNEVLDRYQKNEVTGNNVQAILADNGLINLIEDDQSFAQYLGDSLMVSVPIIDDNMAV